MKTEYGRLRWNWKYAKFPLNIKGLKYALSGHMEIHPCVLQDIGPFGPLPCSHSTSSANHSKQGIGYRWPCAILGWLVEITISSVSDHNVVPKTCSRKINLTDIFSTNSSSLIPGPKTLKLPTVWAFFFLEWCCQQTVSHLVVAPSVYANGHSLTALLCHLCFVSDVKQAVLGLSAS